MFFRIYHCSISPFLWKLNSQCYSIRWISVCKCNLKSHYESLGVSRKATQADIKAAYYKLSMQYHPDRNNTPEAATTFREITDAYEVIGNFKLRKLYDRGLLGNLATEEHSQQTYSNFNPSSSFYKNQPLNYDKETIYRFDEWSRFHYGDTFDKRNQAKSKYEEKSNPSKISADKNENIVYALCLICLAALGMSVISSNSLDEPVNHERKK